jgi:hypothetical protein
MWRRKLNHAQLMTFDNIKQQSGIPLDTGLAF